MPATTSDKGRRVDRTCQRVRSGVTRKVKVIGGIKLSIHAAFVDVMSGQLRFLGSSGWLKRGGQHGMIGKTMPGWAGMNMRHPDIQASDINPVKMEQRQH